VKTAKPSTKKPAAKKPAAKKPAAKKTAGAARRPVARRADFGAATDAFYAKQAPPLREILLALRKLVEEAAPDATASLKWGQPFYAIGKGMMCALAGFKSHVNLILAGPPGAFADPEGRLEGDGKTGRHLKLRALSDLPAKSVRAWLRSAAELARTKS
jgi:hypothetical protein